MRSLTRIPTHFYNFVVYAIDKIILESQGKESEMQSYSEYEFDDHNWTRFENLAGTGAIGVLCLAKHRHLLSRFMQWYFDDNPWLYGVDQEGGFFEEYHPRDGNTINSDQYEGIYEKYTTTEESNAFRVHKNSIRVYTISDILELFKGLEKYE